jgi:ATP-dependent helicase Lhr and Lhr-like helicase
MSFMPEDAQTLVAQTDRHLRYVLGDVGLAFFNFPSLSEVQRLAIPSIGEGGNTLVCAATAAGKTEAVIAPLVWRVRRQAASRERNTQVLAVAPTRALVADLTARLEGPLAQLGWRVGAQTSDFAGAAAAPDVLVTTPESLDSMLVRRFRHADGKISGHILSHISAVFVDEAHCFDSTTRGDQLRFLLTRLRKLRESAREKGWCADSAIQICAASATVDKPEELAIRLLGTGAKAIACPGRRPIDILLKDGGWLRLEEDTPPALLASRLPRVSSAASIGELLWTALHYGECRKALIFVPSRRECDRLGKELRRHLAKRRNLWVETHHGSLSRDHRLRVEKEFHAQRDAVLVATNTLEVGVDIGDVDIVALVGAPPDTSSLLQRIGRGGRRTGLTRLLPLVRNDIEAAALASQLTNAAAGRLEAKHRFNRWDIFPQQVISYIRQNQGLGRIQTQLVDLATETWKQEDTGKIAVAHLEAWCSDGCLQELRGRLHLGMNWQKYDAQEDQEYSFHSNIRSSAAGVAVRNDVTGEIIGHVTATAGGSPTITIGGRQHRVVRQEADIVVTPVTNESADEAEDTPQYAGRRRRIAETFAAHVRQGCGLEKTMAPLVKTTGQALWFHFGGEIFESILRNLYPGHFDKPVLAGIAIRVQPGFDLARIQKSSRAGLERYCQIQGLKLLEDEGLGRFAEELPSIGVETLLANLRVADNFMEWLQSREVSGILPISNWPALAALIV